MNGQLAIRPCLAALRAAVGRHTPHFRSSDSVASSGQEPVHNDANGDEKAEI